jgi:hypothetical protein
MRGLFAPKCLAPKNAQTEQRIQLQQSEVAFLALESLRTATPLVLACVETFVSGARPFIFQTHEGG